jgi:hypothetical protein
MEDETTKTRVWRCDNEKCGATATRLMLLCEECGAGYMVELPESEAHAALYAAEKATYPHP